LSGDENAAGLQKGRRKNKCRSWARESPFSSLSLPYHRQTRQRTAMSSQFPCLHTSLHNYRCLIAPDTFTTTLASRKGHRSTAVWLAVPQLHIMLRVGTALGYGLDDWGLKVRFPAAAPNFSLHHRVQNGSGTHPASYPTGTRRSFHGGKVVGT
jgi:hypothetical protein